jgi:hypothetical protein
MALCRPIAPPGPPPSGTAIESPALGTAHPPAEVQIPPARFPGLLGLAEGVLLAGMESVEQLESNRPVDRSALSSAPGSVASPRDSYR